MKRYILLLLIALLAMPVVVAGGMPDDDDKDPSIQRGIRRLHPERERAKAMKKLQEQMSRKADPKDDPWDMADEVWGTVDLPRVAARDSSAVEGHRITTLNGTLDDSSTGYGYRRLMWQDLPVTATIDQLMLGLVISEDGDYLSKYVTREGFSDEVYFTFNISEDDSLPGPLRLCVRYRANVMLDFDQMVFSIDGYDYMFYPNEHQQGRLDSGKYWAACDEPLGAPYKDLVFALAHGRVVALKMMSARGAQQVKMLTDGQRADFAATLDLYRLFGGTFR